MDRSGRCLTRGYLSVNELERDYTQITLGLTFDELDLVLRGLVMVIQRIQILVN